jgi:hypothetical protein
LPTFFADNLADDQDRFAADTSRFVALRLFIGAAAHKLMALSHAGAKK